MGETSISWTERSWNPVIGCSVLSPGCTNCYAMAMAARLEKMLPDRQIRGVCDSLPNHYVGTTRSTKAGPVWTGKMVLAPEHILTEPLRRRKPTIWFVNSMGDLFHESVPEAWIDQMFAIMALSPQHTLQVLTKRSARMRAYCSDPATPRRVGMLMCDLVMEHGDGALAHIVLIAPGVRPDLAPPGQRVFLDQWPLPNVWKGVSAEDQRRADDRIPDLLATPAAVRFVSAEPLLSGIDFEHLHYDGTVEIDGLNGTHGVLRPHRGESSRLDWIICGGESGPGARPMHPQWARDIRDQCEAAGVPFHFKQWGEWLDEREATVRHLAPGPEMFDRFGSPKGPKWHPYEASDRNGGAMIRVGKARAGRLLDGVEHNGMPAIGARP